MKTTIAALACAVCAAACGSSNQQPAQQPMNSTAENPPPATSPVPSSSTYGSTSTYGSSTPPAATPQDVNQGRGTGAGATSMMGTGTGAAAPSTTGTTGSTGTTPGTAGTTGTTDTSNPSADNTRTNTRDRQGTVTPLQQGNSKAEMGITAAIRRGVMRDHSLSIKAKNVKIITVGTTVTLRGPVDTEAERSAIETLARQTAGVTDVDDQLEVKGSK